MKRILMALLMVGLAGCQKVEVVTAKPGAEVESRIRAYYVGKYPSFAALVALRTQTSSAAEGIKLAELYKTCPVAEIMHSYAPRGRYLTFVETAAASPSTVRILSLDVYSQKDGTSRVGVRVEERKKKGDEPAAPGPLMTEAELRQLLK